MSDSTPRLGLPYILASQSQKEVSHNEALNLLDLAVQACVRDRDLAVPPGNPAHGDCYLVAAAGTGAWAGKAGHIAAWYGSWLFLPPREGLALWVADEDLSLRHDGSAWVASGDGPLRQVVRPFSFADASPVDVTTVAAGRAILAVAIVVQTPFDGAGAALSVGDAAIPDRFMAAAEVDPAAAGRYESSPVLALAADAAVRLSIAPGAGATAGSGLLVLDIQR